MIRVYFLEVDTLDGANVIKGSDIIHDALVETTPAPDVRLVIMDTTSAEHTQLSALAYATLEPTPQQIAIYNSLVTPTTPDQDIDRLKEILANPPPNMPVPDIAEAVKILAKLNGIHA